MVKELWSGNDRAGRRQTRTDRKFNRIVVVHTTENQLGTTCLEVADWQNRQKEHNRYSGYHYLIDQDDFNLYGHPKTFRAFHAGKSATWYEHNPELAGRGNNHIGISMVAEAKDFTEQPQDSRLQGLLNQCSILMANLSVEYGIPLQKLTLAQYEQGRHGFLGHMDVATPAGRKHDPGKDFPWKQVLAEAQKHLAVIKEGKKMTARSQPVVLTEEDQQWLKHFIQASQARKVQDSSLGYATEFIRHIRALLKKEPGISAKGLAAALIDYVETEGQVSDRSPAYTGLFVRTLRNQLGLPESTSPEELAEHLLDGTDYKKEDK